MNQHTLGPWDTSNRRPSAPHYQGAVYDETTGQTVAITYSDEGGHNARLIAAAPEMYEMLRKLAIISPGFHDIYGVSYNEAEDLWATLQQLLNTIEGKEVKP